MVVKSKAVKMLAAVGIAVMGMVTGTGAQTWNSATPPTVTNGATVTIAQGAAGTLNVPAGATVTVTSIGTTVVDNGDKQITLNIPATSKVVWEAKYTCSPPVLGGSAVSIIPLSDAGEFEVVDGSSIINTGGTGAISNSISMRAITVSGGKVSTTSYGGAAISIGRGSVTISGGEVSATGYNGAAVRNFQGDVTVSGGVVSAVAGEAIFGNSISVSSGFVFAHGSAITGYGNVINATSGFDGPADEGVVVAWGDAGSGVAGSSNDLIFQPAAGATVVWAIDRGRHGISYKNGSNEGFFEVAGVTVKEGGGNPTPLDDFYAKVAAYGTTAGNHTITVGADLLLDKVVNVPAPFTPGATLAIKGSVATRVLKRGFEQKSSIGGGLFVVNEGAELILENIIVDGDKSVHTGNQTPLVRVDSGGTLTMNADAILRNNKAEWGGCGGVSLVGGTFNMIGGTILNNAGCGVDFGDSNSTITLGGTAVIKDNVMRDGEKDNVRIYRTKITLSTTTPPAAGMEVWVRRLWIDDNDNIIVNSGATAAHAAFFRSDDPALVVAHEGGQLVFKAAGTGPVTPLDDFYAKVAAYGSAASDVVIEVGQNLTLNRTSVNVPANASGKTLTIKSAAGAVRTLTRGGEDTDHNSGLFVVSGGARLILEGIVIDGDKSVHTGNKTPLVRVNVGGTLTMNTGAVLRNNTGGLSSGGVSVFGGTFNLNGGEISNNVTNDLGGGVGVFGDYSGVGGTYTSGTFNMTGGAIRNNTGGEASGVGVGNGVITMTGGTISNNTGYASVYFTSSDASIMFTLGGTAVIKDNMRKNGEKGNAYVGGTKITLSTTPPASGMEVWVTKPQNDSIIVNSGATAAHAAYFHSDDPNFVVAHKAAGGQLVLRAGGGVVTPVLVESIVVTGAGGASAISAKGGMLQMSASVLPADAANKAVTWSVEPADGSVATVSASGLLTAVGNGAVTVYAAAKDGSGVVGELEVVVSNQGPADNVIDISEDNEGAGFASWSYGDCWGSPCYKIIGDVTVVGKVVDAVDGVMFSIDDGKKVTWKAEYVSSTAYVVEIRGYPSGEFIVANGSSIKATADGAYAILVDGILTVSGGEVVASGDGGVAVRSGCGSTVNITGGRVIASGADGKAIDVVGSTEVTVTVSGGEVRASGDGGVAIDADEDVITVKGGMVGAASGEAIRLVSQGWGSGSIAVNGGFVFAYGDEVLGEGNVVYTLDSDGDEVFTAPTGTGIVAVWDRVAYPGPFDAGDVDGLVVLSAAGAVVKWNVVGGKGGISYEFGVTKGFYEVPGVVVKPVVSVLSGDRVIRVDGVDGSAVVAPVVSLSAEFTAGPNPVAKSAGMVNFYCDVSGRLLSGVLTVYDASGNVVRKIVIRDDTAGALRAPPAQSRRVVGSWDLRDAGGRIVGEGAYLVRGVLKSAGGSVEKVSLLLVIK